MFDFRLKVFHTVAKRLNFTKAAKELYITQPAITKHIHEIERHYQTQLFERNGTRIKLTAAGTLLLQYTQQLFHLYHELEADMNALTSTESGNLRLGASTTAAQYILPAVIASFHSQFTDVRVSLTAGNTEQIEQALLNKDLDIGIVEGKSKASSLKYTPFIKDEIVLVSSVQNPLARKKQLSTEELKNVPLILREPGSGTLDVLDHALSSLGIGLADLTVEMRMSSTESIKQYLLHSDSMAFVSTHAVSGELQRNECCIVAVKGLQIERYFNFIQSQGQPSKITTLFMKFASRYNFRLF